MKEVEFTKWIVYENGIVKKSSTNRQIALTVPNTKNWTAIAYYGTPPTGNDDNEPHYNKETVTGRNFYLPGEALNITLHYPGYDGNYTFISSQIYNITLEPLVAYILNPDTWDTAYVSFDYMNVSMLYNFSVIREKCYRRSKIGGYVLVINNETLKYLPKVTYISYNGSKYPEYRYWVLLAISAWQPYKNLYLDGFDDSTFTTYAVYNLTSIWHNWTAVKLYRQGMLPENASLGIIWYQPIVVSSLNITVWGYYDREGVYIVWETWYRYLPPAELNISMELPHQDLWFTLEANNTILFQQFLAKGSRFYGPSMNGTVLSDYYVKHEWFLDKWWIKQVNTVAKVRWSFPMGGIGPRVYKSEEKVIPIVSLAMSLIGIREDPLWLKLKWKPLNESSLPGYCRYCPCIRIDVLTEWDGKIWENVQIKDGNDPTIWYVELPVSKKWPRHITLYVIQRHTMNLIFYILPTRL